MAQHQQQLQQRTPQNSPPSSSAQNNSWPLPPPQSSASVTSSTTDRYSSKGDLRISSSGGVGGGSSTGTAGGARPTSVSSSTGLRGLFGRRSRSQQYQDLPHKPVDPEAPRLPKVYLSPPSSPELLSQNTTPEKVRMGINGKSSAYSDHKPSPPAVPDSSSQQQQRNHNRQSVTSTAASLSPTRMRRRRRDPTPFNILVIGFLGSGKTSFTRFLKDSLGDSKRIRNVSHLSNEDAMPGNIEEDLAQPPNKTNGFERHYMEIEVDGERVGLTIFDSEGFGPREQDIVDIQLTILINFITGKFEDTFAEVISYLVS